MNRRRLLGIGCALVALALALGPAAPSAQAQLIADKVDPALRDLMQADPLALLPVIVEMQQPLPPFIGAPNVDRALEALALLRLAFGLLAMTGGGAFAAVVLGGGFSRVLGFALLGIAFGVQLIAFVGGVLILGLDVGVVLL